MPGPQAVPQFLHSYREREVFPDKFLSFGLKCLLITWIQPCLKQCLLQSHKPQISLLFFLSWVSPSHNLRASEPDGPHGHCSFRHSVLTCQQSSLGSAGGTPSSTVRAPGGSCCQAIKLNNCLVMFQNYNLLEKLNVIFFIWFLKQDEKGGISVCWVIYSAGQGKEEEGDERQQPFQASAVSYSEFCITSLVQDFTVKMEDWARARGGEQSPVCKSVYPNLCCWGGNQAFREKATNYLNRCVTLQSYRKKIRLLVNYVF